MQGKITIPVPEDLHEKTGTELMLDLQKDLQLYKEEIGYMIQDYYPKQKVRIAELVFPAFETSSFYARFSLEEFSSCAAIDSYDLSGMKIQVSVDTVEKVITISGEEWPE